MFDAIVKRSWQCAEILEVRDNPFYRVTCYLRIFFPKEEQGSKVLYEAEAWRIGTSGYVDECCVEDLIRITNKKVNSRIAVETSKSAEIFYHNRRFVDFYEEEPLPLRYRSTEIHSDD